MMWGGKATRGWPVGRWPFALRDQDNTRRENLIGLPHREETPDPSIKDTAVL